MKSIDLADFYRLGTALTSFKRLPDLACETTDFAMASWNAGAMIQKLLAGDEFDVGVAKASGKDLTDYLELLDKKYCQDAEGKRKWPKDDQKLLPWEVSTIKERLEKFETVLSAHTKQAATYYAAKIGIFETGDLVERAEQVFAPDVRKKVPQAALEEYRSAGRALAFDMPTASAFHVARAIEIVLRIYRDHFVKTPGGRTMGGMLHTLKAHAKAGVAPIPTARTLRQLDQIRDLDRNRIMHPDDTFSSDLAGIMFFNGISAITAMVSEI